MKSERALLVRNHQRDRKIDSAFLRKAVTTLLEEVMKIREYEVGVHLVTRPRIKELNETYLRHEGSTDVITFDYLDLARPDWLAGDIFICVAASESTIGMDAVGELPGLKSVASTTGSPRSIIWRAAGYRVLPRW